MATMMTMAVRRRWRQRHVATKGCKETITKWQFRLKHANMWHSAKICCKMIETPFIFIERNPLKIQWNVMCSAKSAALRCLANLVRIVRLASGKEFHSKISSIHTASLKFDHFTAEIFQFIAALLLCLRKATLLTQICLMLFSHLNQCRVFFVVKNFYALYVTIDTYDNTIYL